MDQKRVRVTIFLRHDQTKDLNRIDDILYAQGFWSKFPPEDVSIVSWQVLMGIGQVVTLEGTPDKIREINVGIETMAWGAFKTEFYLTYDFLPVLEKKRAEAKLRAERGEVQ